MSKLFFSPDLRSASYYRPHIGSVGSTAASTRQTIAPAVTG